MTVMKVGKSSPCVFCTPRTICVFLLGPVAIITNKCEGNCLCFYFWKLTAISARISYEIQSFLSTKLFGGASGEESAFL